MPVEDQVAIVTGGGAGIGKACSLRLAQEGARIVIGDMSEVDGKATCEMIQADGGQAVYCPGNVCNESDCHAFAKAALDKWGRIDILVANAGVRVGGSLLDSTEEDWDKILGVNLKGVAYSCKAVLPTMIEQHSGSIVIISSANAEVGRSGMPLYDATKAAVLSLTRSLAVAHGKDGVRINSICPGYTMTDYHERSAAKRGLSPEELRERNAGYGLLGKPGEPHQIAAAVYFMASDEASNVTGQYLMVDGGISVTGGRR